jgi:hypothetical protein
MHSPSRALIVVLAMGLGAVACGGGTTMSETAQAPEAAPAAASTVRSELIDDWEGQKETLVNIADAMPEDMWGFRPTPAQRTFGEQVMHVAELNVKLLGLVGGTATGVFWVLLGHSMDTYGQMAVYLRLNGVVPPASRGV